MRLRPAEHPLGAFNGGDGDKAAQAAMFQLGRLLDQPPFFLGVVREHLGSQRYLAGAP